MEKTWRWFGKKDKITLQMLRQIGVEGIVTALHDIKNGEIWTEEAIMDMKNYIEAAGLKWSVVESLPVCEAIKYGGPERDQLIENYKVSLANLGKCAYIVYVTISCLCLTGLARSLTILGKMEAQASISTRSSLFILTVISSSAKGQRRTTAQRITLRLMKWPRL